jgi:hypothetical protein
MSARTLQACVGHSATKPAAANFLQQQACFAVGIKEVQDDIWLVSFMDYDLGYFDLETQVLEPLENPFGSKVLPMSLIRCVSPMCPGRTRGKLGTRTPDLLVRRYEGGKSKCFTGCCVRAFWLFLLLLSCA